MFEGYKNEVIAAYKKKQAEGDLSHNLESPTPNQIKDECLIIYNRGCSTEDEDMLRFFFGVKADSGNYGEVIEGVDVDKFRPMLNLIRAGVKKPRKENVELLAWLINFKPRPFQVWQKTKKPGRRKRTFTWTPAKIKSAVIAFTLVVAASLGTYFSIPNQTSTIVNPILTGKEQCMYWTGESYRPILCNQKIENTPIIALDPQQLSGLKKITQPDTLTRNSINKVGYAKLGRKEIEFYTTTGNHPTIYNKRILPMTAYILNKYIVNK